MIDLESCSRDIARMLRLDPDTWNKFMAKLQELKLHDLNTYNHCLRVGIYSHGLARSDHVEYEKLAFFGGAGHDSGKCSIDTDVINASKWTPELSQVMHEHPRAGFERWKGDFLFTGIVAGLHHYYQPNGYGIDPNVDIPDWVSVSTREMIIEATRVVMVSDFFDAITTRDNDKGLVSNPKDLVAVSTVMLERFSEQRPRVLWLLDHKIN